MPARAGAVPGGLLPLVQAFRLPALARHRTPLGGMDVRRLPKELVARWYRPLLTDRGIRRDLAKFCRGVDSECHLRAAEKLPSFGRPALVVRAPGTA